jgi:hypothetical protein
MAADPMIDVIFTLDYEIYGDGTGSLQELVYEPALRLEQVFREYGAKFVVFAELCELEKIEAYGADPAINLVKKQLADLYSRGFEIALHLHPQWSNAYHKTGKWFLDYGEYNLCTLMPARIGAIVENALGYCRYVLDDSGFTPLSFRAGNWLFQPAGPAVDVLASHGVRIDSSVFKGGLQRANGLDYRPTEKYGYFWTFSQDVNEVDPSGSSLEVPIYTKMVRPWKMVTQKRMAFSHRLGSGGGTRTGKIARAADFLRWNYPLKLDFSRMTLDEMLAIARSVIDEDRARPSTYRPIVAIGHTKDLRDVKSIRRFLMFLGANGIPVSTFTDIYPKLKSFTSTGNAAVTGDIQATNCASAL